MANFIRTFVLGHPIAHSRSPLIHNHWIKIHNLAGSYEAIDVEPGSLVEFLNHVRSGEFAGGNITVPLKEEAVAAVDHLTEIARSIGAVNTVYMEEGKLWGDNTDAYGFSANLSDKAHHWQNCQTALIIGAGGAARAVIKSLLEADFAKIIVLNRTLSRAEDLMSEFGQIITAAPLNDFSVYAPMADLIVNTSSIGMAGKDGQFFDFSTAKSSTLVTDIVYVPLETGFLKSARLAGLETIDGLGMLLHQAAPGFERWFGLKPDITFELRSMIEADLFKAKP